jgi:transcriptional regulator with XRE-family HTH domain
MASVKLLPEKEIGANLKAIIASMNLSQREFAALIGKKPSAVSSFVNAENGCNPSKLVQEVVVHGFNANWYLTGQGPMNIADLGVRDEAALRFEQFGRALGAVLETYYPVLREGAGTDSNSLSKKTPSVPSCVKDILDDGTTVIPYETPLPGPSPDISLDEFDTLRKRRRVQ